MNFLVSVVAVLIYVNLKKNSAKCLQDTKFLYFTFVEKSLIKDLCRTIPDVITKLFRKIKNVLPYKDIY